LAPHLSQIPAVGRTTLPACFTPYFSQVPNPCARAPGPGSAIADRAATPAGRPGGDARKLDNGRRERRHPPGDQRISEWDSL